MRYLPFDTFILRTPVLSIEKIDSISSEDIREMCSDPFISEAIALASPALYQEIQKYLNDTSQAKDYSKLEYSILKYLLRMGYRCTPFGLFSGCSIGKIASVSSIELDERDSFKTKTDLDMHFLCSWVQEIEKDAKLRSVLRFLPNNTLYKVGEELRYVEYRYIDSQRKHFVVSVGASEYLLGILEKAKQANGATLEELAASIVDEEVTIEDAVEFINQIIDNQIIVSSIAPTLTGDEYLNLLHRELSGTPYEETLRMILSGLNQVDDNSNSEKIKTKAELTDLLMGINKAANSKFLLQTNLYVNTLEATISESLVGEVSEALNVINKLREPYKNNRLENFKKAFHERYETEEIPLAIAMDVEIGIGYGKERDAFSISPFVDDLYFPAYSENDRNQINWNQVDHFLYNKIRAFSWDNSQGYIEIYDSEMASFKEDWEQLPETFSVLASIVSIDRAEQSGKVYIDYAGGSSACNLLSRFSTLDQKIEDFLHEISDKERDEKNIYAEIVHLPEARTGNILHRPHLRGYEIPYLTATNIDSDFKIEIEDMYVSVKDDKIVLRSKKHGKEIIPMLSNAHYYLYNSLPVYYFLCDMQNQTTRNGLNINIRNLKQFFDFIPRLVYKNIILSPAQWVFNKSQMAKMKDVEGLLAIFKSRRMPGKVVFSEGDNELLINTENPLSIEMFLSLVKGKESIELKEYLFDNEKALVRRNTEAFTNEVIFSFYKSNKN